MTKKSEQIFMKTMLKECKKGVILSAMFNPVVGCLFYGFLYREEVYKNLILRQEIEELKSKENPVEVVKRKFRRNKES